MNNARSPLNKTIDFGLDEGSRYLERCINAGIEAEAAETDYTDRIVLGECVEALKRLPDKKYRLLIADPPYNMDKDFGGNVFHRRGESEYESFTEGWITAALHCLTDDASVYVCCDWVCSSIIERVLRRHFTVRNRITWQREKGRAAKANWKNGCEDIWFATVGENYTFNLDSVRLRRRVIAPYREDGQAKDWDENTGYRDTAPSNFWDDITVPFWSMKENTAHPTQKSEKLMARLILAGSDPGDCVLDPFMGSGTVPVTAKKLGRHYTGIEINPQYCAWAEKRLEDAEADACIQGYSDGVFWERNTCYKRRKKTDGDI